MHQDGDRFFCRDDSMANKKTREDEVLELPVKRSVVAEMHK